MRTLKDGTEVNELDEPIRLEVFTKCPEKYTLIDMETGQAYVGNADPESDNHWSLIEWEELQDA